MAESENWICNSKKRDKPGVHLSLILSFKINVTKEKNACFQLSRYSLPTMKWSKTPVIWQQSSRSLSRFSWVLFLLPHSKLTCSQIQTWYELKWCRVMGPLRLGSTSELCLTSDVFKYSSAFIWLPVFQQWIGYFFFFQELFHHLNCTALVKDITSLFLVSTGTNFRNRYLSVLFKNSRKHF